MNITLGIYMDYNRELSGLSLNYGLDSDINDQFKSGKVTELRYNIFFLRLITFSPSSNK